MPSGFQQDSNQLAPGFYRVVWVASTGTYPTADGTDNGAVTPNSGDSFATLPATLALAQARARGNMRFRNILNRLTGLADCQIIDVEVGGDSTADSQATSLAFTARFDRPASIIEAQKARNVADTGVATNVAGASITTISLAIEDAVVRGFRDATTASCRTDNLVTGSSQTSVTVAAPDSAADILADVTVVLIDGAELITSDNAGAAE
jgi:hypothetical protein